MSNAPGSDARLAMIVDAALAGAKEVMAVYATDFTVERKSDDTPVSAADRNAEAVILARLSAAMPGVPVVAEEAVSEGAIPTIGRSFLLVDPLDGTKEFVNRNGEFTVNIAVVEDGVPVCGVVLAPALSLAYAGSPQGAWKGRTDARFGAVEDWQPISVRAAGPSPVAVASRSHLTPATEAAVTQARCDGQKLHRLVAEILPGGGGRGGFLSAARADHGMGHRRGRCGAAGRRRHGRDARRRRRSRYGKTRVEGMRGVREPVFPRRGRPRACSSGSISTRSPKPHEAPRRSSSRRRDWTTTRSSIPATGGSSKNSAR